MIEEALNVQAEAVEVFEESGGRNKKDGEALSEYLEQLEQAFSNS